MNAFSWLGLDAFSKDAVEHAGEPPKWDGVDRWVDVPREEWITDTAVDLLPIGRQQFWQQREAQHGHIRLQNVAWHVVQQEVFAHVMGRVVTALNKLERRL